MGSRINLGGRVFTLLGLVAGALAVAGGIAWATIPDGTGVIHGCYTNNDGQLRVIDTAAGDTCKKRESAISWNQQGPAGSMTYAVVNSTGTVDAGRSNGVTNANVTHPNTGFYCFSGMPSFHSAVATLAYGKSSDGNFLGHDTRAATIWLGYGTEGSVYEACPGDEQLVVILQGRSGELLDSSFSISFN